MKTKAANPNNLPDRMLREVWNTNVTHDLWQDDVAPDHIEAVEAIYGKRDSWIVARV